MGEVRKPPGNDKQKPAEKIGEIIYEDDDLNLLSIITSPTELVSKVAGGLRSPTTLMRMLLPFDLIIIDTNKPQRLQQRK